MVKQLSEDMRQFISNKIYCLIIFFAAICSYGFKMTHVTVGIDDTATELYFEDGLAPTVGRWTLYIINKLFHLSDFSPWMTDFAGVLLLILATLIWCVLLWRFFGEEVPLLGYAFFSAIFITCPLISEVYVYYLHNGIGIGYALSALSLLLVQNALKKDRSAGVSCFILLNATLLITTAIGCYESFALVYVIGALIMFIAVRMGTESSYRANYYKNVLMWGFFCGIPLLLSIFLRMIIVRFICIVFNLSIPENFNSIELRSAFTLFSGNLSELAMYFKRFWVKYYLNGVVYLPIAVLASGMGVLLIFCMTYGIKRKDIFLPLAAVAVPIMPVLMIFIDGKEPYYRACQYVPLIGAFGVFLLFMAGEALLPVWGKRIGLFLAMSLLWNQCADMNKWFYLDYVKYEYFKDVMLTISSDLRRDYDLSKPVVFGSACEVPWAVMKEACVSYDTWQYKFIRTMGDFIDEHLTEKYNEIHGRGYVFAETPSFSTLQWGVTAFDGTSRELGNFLSMLGYEIRIETDLQIIEDVLQVRENMAHFPQKGYIQEFEDYIIVNF